MDQEALAEAAQQHPEPEPMPHWQVAVYTVVIAGLLFWAVQEPLTLARQKVNNELQMTVMYERQAKALERIAQTLEGARP